MHFKTLCMDFLCWVFSIPSLANLIIICIHIYVVTSQFIQFLFLFVSVCTIYFFNDTWYTFLSLCLYKLLSLYIFVFFYITIHAILYIDTHTYIKIYLHIHTSSNIYFLLCTYNHNDTQILSHCYIYIRTSYLKHYRHFVK